MTEPSTHVRVRPFEKLLEATNNVLMASGRIDGDVYVLTFGAAGHRLPIVGQGVDQWGSYAMVEQSKTPLEAGFVLTVERNLEEPDWEAGIVFEPGCRIALTRPPGGVELPPNVIAPPDASVSIYFNAAGTMEGYGMAAYLDKPPAAIQ